MKQRRFASSLIRILLFASLFAASASQLQAKTIEHLRFGKPVKAEADWSSEIMRWGDLNDDKRLDFFTINNRHSVIEAYYQQPKDAELPLEKKKWVIERTVSDAVLLDMDGDRREDIVLAGEPCFVLYQGDDGAFEKSRDLSFDAKYLFVVSLNDDKLPDLAGFANEELLLATRKDSKTREFDITKRPNGHSPVNRPLLADLDGDGLEDLAYVSATNRDQVVIRSRNKAGGFNPERTYKTGLTLSIDAMRDGKQGAWLAAVEDNTRTAKILAFEQASKEEMAEFPFDDVQIIPFTGSPAGEHFAVADLNGDGADEAFRFSPESAELNRFAFGRSHAETFSEHPMFSGISKARFLMTGKPVIREIVVMTSKEEAFGIVRPNEDGEPGLPEPFDAGGKPLVFDLCDMNADGLDDLLCGLKNDANNKVAFHYFPGLNNGDFQSSPSVTLEFKAPLGDDFDPEDIIAGDMNGDGRPDLTVFFTYSPPQIFLQQEGGAFKALLTQSGLKKGWFNEIRARHFRLIDFDGDGKDEIALAQKEYVRIISLSPDGELDLLAQFNGEDSQSDLFGILVMDANDDGQKEAVVLDKGNKRLLLFHPDEPEEPYHTVDLGSIEGKGLRIADMNGDGKSDLVIEGRNNLGLLMHGVAPKTLETLARNSTEIEDGKYITVRCADINGDGLDEVLLMEMTENILEFFQFHTPNEWNKVFQFKVFQGEGPTFSGYRLKSEMSMPRQIEAVDYNGDGLADLALLLHNMLIIYPQEQ
ncbi:VCBS repeat-containing protein [Candidatus Sumerlaeota bacterium]|nr:VCBS repeat-containing protein [Candidatus Sumerlaeota bacterium]